MSYAKKISVSLYPEQIERLNDRRGGLPLSSQIADDLKTYWRILDTGLARARKKLTRKEASLLFDVLATTQWDTSTLFLMLEGGITKMIEDACHLGDKDIDFDVDGGWLNNKINKMSVIERLALRDWIEVIRRKGDTTSLENAIGKFPERIDEN